MYCSSLSIQLKPKARLAQENRPGESHERFSSIKSKKATMSGPISVVSGQACSRLLYRVSAAIGESMWWASAAIGETVVVIRWSRQYYR